MTSRLITQENRAELKVQRYVDKELAPEFERVGQAESAVVGKIRDTAAQFAQEEFAFPTVPVAHIERLSAADTASTRLQNSAVTYEAPIQAHEKRIAEAAASFETNVEAWHAPKIAGVMEASKRPGITDRDVDGIRTLRRDISDVAKAANDVQGAIRTQRKRVAELEQSNKDALDSQREQQKAWDALLRDRASQRRTSEKAAISLSSQVAKVEEEVRSHNASAFTAAVRALVDTNVAPSSADPHPDVRGRRIRDGPLCLALGGDDRLRSDECDADAAAQLWHLRVRDRGDLVLQSAFNRKYLQASERVSAAVPSDGASLRWFADGTLRMGNAALSMGAAGTTPRWVRGGRGSDFRREATDEGLVHLYEAPSWVDQRHPHSPPLNPQTGGRVALPLLSSGMALVVVASGPNPVSAGAQHMGWSDPELNPDASVAHCAAYGWATESDGAMRIVSCWDGRVTDLAQQQHPADEPFCLRGCLPEWVADATATRTVAVFRNVSTQQLAKLSGLTLKK